MPRHRGRRSRDEQVEAVVPLIRADVWTLKDQHTFDDALGVKALTGRFAGELWPLGIALHLLIAGAVSDVSEIAAVSQTRSATRITAFLRLWYDEHQTVTAAARQFGLSRSHVAKTIQRPAVRLVAQRVLALMQHADPASQSEGVQWALERHTRHTGHLDSTGTSCIRPHRALLPPELSA